MSMIRLREQKRLWFGGAEQGGMWIGAEKVWAKPSIPVGPPTVANVQDGGYLGTTASVAMDGTVTITNAASAITGEHGVSHYFVRADNMEGKTLTVRRSAASPNDIGNVMSAWQMAWTYDPEGEWFPFDSVVNSSGTIVATKTAPLTQSSVYIARRPVFSSARWDQAIARWRANPLTSPTASGDAQFVVGTLPANQYAPAMSAYGFKFGAGPDAITVTGNIHVEEHIAAYAYEGFVDWLLGSDPKAVDLRSRCTFYCYPKLNPQARYAGASRQDVYGNNANRIFDAAYDSNPLSKLMRDAWAADLPATVVGALDFHDVPPKGATRGEMFWSGDPSPMNKVVAQYRARTGLEVIVNPVGTTVGTVTHYLRTVFGSLWTLTPEHGIVNSVNVPEWQAWGRDYGEALYEHYQEQSGASEWIAPVWLPAVPATTTATKNADGSVTVTNPTGNPGAAFLIPEGKNIEVVVDLTLANANAIYLRQSEVQALTVAQSVELHMRDKNTGPYYRLQQITWDATKPYFGVFAARVSTSSQGAFTLKPTVKYRVIP